MIRVIMCVHDGVRFLEAQLQTIVAQTTAVDIVHLFDFGSIDGSRELARSLAQRWPQVRIREIDAVPGVTRSFFFAMREVSNESGRDDIIFLSDQDDTWDAGKVEAVVSRINEEGNESDSPLLLFHDVRVCDQELREISPTYYDGRPFSLPRDLEDSRLLIVNPLIGHTMAFNSAMLELAVSSLNPEDYVMHDWALALFAQEHGKLLFVNEVLSSYRQHDRNILGAGRKRSFSAQVYRAFYRSRAIIRQAEAFSNDRDKGGRTNQAPLAPGVGPLWLRIAMLFLLRGPTIWHRLASVIPLIDRILTAPRRESGSAMERVTRK